MLKDNLIKVQENIRAACQKAGRDEREVTLIAVSKTKPVWMIRKLYEEGVLNFGENKVQELVEKYEALPKEIKWHMIGHLQRNKVKHVIDKSYLIHSIDSLRLAEEVSRQGEKRNLTVNILLEVNIAEEKSKFGITKEETIFLVQAIAKLPNIQVKGLMTVAPYTEDPENNRKYFRNLKELSVDITTKNIDNVCMDTLSMGMTSDYMIAIEEGATIVRVGTGIFGERTYISE